MNLQTIGAAIGSAKGKKIVPLRFTSQQDGSTISYNTGNGYKHPDLRIKKSGDAGFSTWDYSEIVLNTGEYLDMIGNNTSAISSGGPAAGFVITGDVAASGDISSLFAAGTSINLVALFMNCTGLTTPPELPFTTLTPGCYNALFKGCTGLTSAPALPATDLSSARDCYRSMFEGCSSLTIAPALPATILTYSVYQEMFKNCDNLTQAPELLVENLEPSCYQGMFTGCSSLTYIKCLAKNISANHCTTDWLSGVAASGTFTKAAAMSDWTTGDSGIPSGWTVQDA